jgi:hypothetical protein
MCHRWTGLVVLGALTLAPSVFAGTSAPASDGLLGPEALAQRIDYWLARRQADQGVRAAPLADDAEFIRRVYLDLAGCVPPVTDARDFLDDPRPDKRRLWVEMLLDGRKPSRKPDAYAQHFANVWRAWLLSRAGIEQAAALTPATEKWFETCLKANLPYDALVRQLITAAPAGARGDPPNVFDQINENKPESLAGTTSRLFLGVKLECAQCHNDRSGGSWTQTQFWSFAAFFAGNTPGRPQADNQRSIKIPGKDKIVRARFLEGPAPIFQAGADPRAVLADWVVSPTNPYFARAGVNRIWSYFFGTGLTDPVDEQGAHNPPSHPQLLEELAGQFADHHFDLKYLIRAIVASQAYQRTSTVDSPVKDDPRLFVRMPVRGLSAEQLFDSLAEVTEFEDMGQGRGNRLNDGTNLTPRQQFLARFSGQQKPTETPTSILQALYLMNSSFVADRTSLEHNKTLATLAGQKTPHARRVETLFLVVLSRKPTAAELARCVGYLERGGASADPREALADVFWALINSPEFFVNH